jgi:hypothetical protein
MQNSGVKDQVLDLVTTCRYGEVPGSVGRVV